MLLSFASNNSCTFIIVTSVNIYLSVYLVKVRGYNTLMTTKFTFKTKDQYFTIEERSKLKAFARAKSWLLAHDIISPDENYRWDELESPYTYRLHLSSDDSPYQTSRWNFLKNLSESWTEIAESAVEAVRYDGKVYGLGSELAVRRLAHHHKSFDVGCSARLAMEFNRPGWFFKPCDEDVQPH